VLAEMLADVVGLVFGQFTSAVGHRPSVITWGRGVDIGD
jgi:hypothetical protein